jgi:hypothetical protein
MHTLYHIIAGDYWLVTGNVMQPPICVQQSRWRKRNRRHSLLVSRRPLGQAVSSLEKEEAVLEHICTYICTYVHTRIYIYTYIYACTRMLYLVPLYMFEMYLLYTGIYVWIDTYCSRRTLTIDRHRGFIVELVMCMFKSFIFAEAQSWCTLHWMNSSISPYIYDLDELVPEW